MRSSGESNALLEAAIEHRRDLCCRAALGVLQSLEYDPALLDRARRAMRMGATGWRQSVLTILESALAPSHRELLALLADAGTDRSAPDHQRSRDERLVELGMGRYEWASPWVRACALRAMTASTPGALDVLTRAASDTNQLVAETAAAALATLRGGAATKPGRELKSYAAIDKAVLLKEVSIFSAIPHEELADIAGLLSERHVEAGETVVTKGDVGDCLYVIASGAVSVLDGDRMLARLGKNQFFGELALLDAEPRSATVSATEATQLFRLGQADFYALMTERPQIVYAINHGLCQMIRERSAAQG